MLLKKLIPIRHPTGDLFVADILDAIPKDDLGSMEHPMFSLSKKPDFETRIYEHNGNKVVIQPSANGRATIWDKDILIFCISQLITGMRQGREASPVVTFRAHDLLVAINRHLGGSDYDRLMLALDRLDGTRIRTDIKTGGKRVRSGFGLLHGWDVIERAPDGKMSSIVVELSNWLYRAVLSSEVLTISHDYFRLYGGVERRLYEIARKHCGYQKSWRIGIQLLQLKCGSRSTLKEFRRAIKYIAASNIIPDYRLKYHQNKDQVQISYTGKDRAEEQGELDLQ